MSPRVFAPQACRDLREAALWLARTNPPVAQALIEEAERAALRLAAQPTLGRQRPELLPPPYRLWSLRGFPYLLIYNAATAPPRILRVLHASRDMPSALAEFPG